MTHVEQLILCATNKGDFYRNIVTPWIRDVTTALLNGGATFRMTKSAALALARAEIATRQGMKQLTTKEKTDFLNQFVEHYAEEIAHNLTDQSPSEVSISAFDYDSDVYGNPTAHYEVNSRRVTNRRIQTGYDSYYFEGGACVILREHVGKVMYPFYFQTSIQGSRYDRTGVYADYKLKDNMQLTIADALPDIILK